MPVLFKKNEKELLIVNVAEQIKKEGNFLLILLKIKSLILASDLYKLT